MSAAGEIAVVLCAGLVGWKFDILYRGWHFIQESGAVYRGLEIEEFLNDGKILNCLLCYKIFLHIVKKIHA